jgi:hypothetical protein
LLIGLAAAVGGAVILGTLWADGSGTASYKLMSRSFGYLYDPKSKRLHMDDVQGDCTLSGDDTLTADLRFSFVDVLQSGMPTVDVQVEGAFQREK